MANEDHAQKMKDALGNFPVDTSSLESLAKSQAVMAERLSSIAIEAAQRSTDLSARWVQDSLSKLTTLSEAKAEPAEYAKAASEFMSSSAQASAESLAAFAEIARKVQAETLALLMTVGKDMTADLSASASKGQTTQSDRGSSS